MPNSCTQGKELIKKWFAKQPDIQTVLDVGCGQATYPKLLGIDSYEWYGVEVWAPYIEQFKLYEIYRRVYIADFTMLSQGSWVFEDIDCVILGDVIEHVADKEMVELFFEELDVRHVVVSVPLSDSAPYEGRGHYNNPFEKHVSYWTFAEVTKLLNWEVAEKEGDIGVFIR